MSMIIDAKLATLYENEVITHVPCKFDTDNGICFDIQESDVKVDSKAIERWVTSPSLEEDLHETDIEIEGVSF